MNLNVNFIQPAEVRSASMVSIKSILTMIAIFVPLILILLISYAYISYAEQRSAQELAQGIWEKTEKRKNRSVELAGELKALQASLAELQGWQRTRIDWNEALLAIQQHVPTSAQLKVMRMEEKLEIDAKFQVQRIIKATLNGRCEGPEANAKVEAFRQALSDQPPFRDAIKSIEIMGFQEDTEAGADESDRVFQIEIVFNPRLLNEAPAK